MNKNNNLWIFGILIMFLVFLASTHFRQPSVDNSCDTVRIERTDTIYKTDTFKINKPVPEYIEKIKTDTVYSKEGDEIELITENKTYIDTVCNKKDTAIVTSYITGVNATLDSLSVRFNKREIIKTNTITITKTISRKKPFSYGLQVGAGYGIFNKKVDMYIGVGGTLNF